MKRTLFASLFLLGFATTNLHAEIIGEWTFDNQNGTNTSGHARAGDHEATAIGNVKYVKRGNGYCADLRDPNTSFIVQGTTDRANGSAGGGPASVYHKTFDDDIFSSSGTRKFSISLLAKGFPGKWCPFVAKKGEAGWGWQFRAEGATDGSNSYLTTTIRNSNAGTKADPKPPEDPKSQRLEDAIPGFDKDAWHHYATVWDGSKQTLDIFVDGVNVLSLTNYNPKVKISRGEFLTFGARDHDKTPLNGEAAVMLDQIRIYNHALNSSELATLRSELPEPCTMGLLALGGTALLARRRKRKNA